MSELARLTAVFAMTNGKNATIGLDFSVGGLVISWTNTELQLLVDAGKDGWSGSPNLRADFSADLSLVQCEAYAYDRIVNPDSPPPFKRSRTTDIVVSDDTPVAGTRAGNSAPPQVATAVTFNTGLGGRSRRGRVYLPQIVETDVNAAGIIVEAFRAQLEGDFDDWVVGMQNAASVGSTFTHEVVSMVLPSAFSRVVTARTVNNRVDTQRRRLGV